MMQHAQEKNRKKNRSGSTRIATRIYADIRNPRLVPRSHPRLSASILALLFFFCIATTGHAQEAYEDAAKMADEIHKKVATDVIYTEQETKALYYQNIQIIELLKEIRELLRQGLEKEEDQP